MAKMDVVILPDGSVRFMLREGEFEEGRERLNKLVNGLQSSGLKITPTGKVERHSHGDGEGQVHTQKEHQHN